MSKEEEPELNQEEDLDGTGVTIWVDPGIHIALRAAADDIVHALSELKKRIENALDEVEELFGEEQWIWFDHLVFRHEQIASIRMAMYRLLVAISCEELINRFCYFELPKEASELLEKLQPAEKLLMIAAFLKLPDIKSSHLYEGLKAIFEWRNRFAHGHNPDFPAKSLHKNHADPVLFREQTSTFEDELRGLQKTARSYEELTLWLHKTAVDTMIKHSRFHLHAAHIVKIFQCFHFKKMWLAPDSEGYRYRFFNVVIDTKALDKLAKAIDHMEDEGQE